MKIVEKDFRITTKNRNQMIDITSQVRSFVSQSGITNELLQCASELPSEWRCNSLLPSYDSGNYHKRKR